MGKAFLDGSTGHIGRDISSRVVAMTAMLLLGGCAQLGSLGLDAETPQVSGIATSSTGPRSKAELEKATAYWGEQHNKNPRDHKTALSYARNLKALGRKPQALTVLQSSYMFASDDREYLSEYGRLALDLGQVSTAGELLARADDPAKPDWRIISARGTVLAKQGNYKEAIGLYEQARQLAPEQASVLNNLAMAYTMDGQAGRGEELLRQAQASPGGNADPRVQQNLALVIGLQGKGEGQPGAQAGLGSAESVQQQALPFKAVHSDALPVAAKTSAKSSLKPKPAAAAATDPDQIIRAAMEAEQVKAARANSQ